MPEMLDYRMADPQKSIYSAYVLCIVGSTLSAAVLIACLGRPGELIEDFAPIYCGLALAMLCAGAVMLKRNRRYKSATAAAAILLVILMLSFLPLYVAHWTPHNGGQTHRHVIWELGHIH